MNKTVLLYSLLFMFGVFISAISQVILKKSAAKTYDNIIKEYLNVPVIAAYTIFFLATFLSIIAYKGIPLSLGPVLDSTSYVYIGFFGSRFFGEKFNKKKIIAVGLIIVGIVVYSIFG